jgi:hypothetical protein
MYKMNRAQGATKHVMRRELGKLSIPASHIPLLINRTDEMPVSVALWAEIYRCALRQYLDCPNADNRASLHAVRDQINAMLSGNDPKAVA